MGSDRLLAAAGLAQLVLLGERQRGHVIEAPDGARIGEAGGRELLPIKARTGEQKGDLIAIGRVVRLCLTLPGRALDLRLEQISTLPERRGMLDRRLAGCGQQEADRRFALLAEMGEKPGGSRQNGHAADYRVGNFHIGEHRRDCH